MILLDTDIAVDIVREVRSAIEWVASVADVVAISGFTTLELIAGARNRLEQDKLQRTLGRFQTFWLSYSGCATAAETYLDLRLAHGIGAFDCLIAHTALELDVPLYTFNTKHFQHIRGLKTIQPYTR